MFFKYMIYEIIDCLLAGCPSFSGGLESITYHPSTSFRSVVTSHSSKFVSSSKHRQTISTGSTRVSHYAGCNDIFCGNELGLQTYSLMFIEV